MDAKTKNVLLKTQNGRNFRVTFAANDNLTDFRAFKETFYKMCDTDCDLNTLRTSERYCLSFQKYDSTFDCNVELTDGDEIENGTVIELFMFTSAFLETPVESLESNGNSVENNDTSISTRDTEEIPLPSEEISNLISVPSITKMDIAATKNRRRTTMKFKVSGLVYPCALPKFSAVVKQHIENGSIYKIYGSFVRECAAFLLALVEKPSKSDYDVFCRTLSDNYDFVNVNNIPESCPYGFFKKTLSHSIRNARYYRYKKSTEMDSSSVEVLIDTNKVADADNTNEIQIHNIEIAKSLKKKSIDKVHILELVKMTASHRRKTIVSSNLNILELQLEFPALQFQEWILFDFSYDTLTSFEERYVSYSKGITSLQLMKGEESMDDFSCLQLFKWVEQKLGSKKVESCISLLKVGDTPVTTCAGIQAPYLTAYVGEDGQIAAAYILAQGGIVCELNNRSPFSIFDTLLGVYFTFSYDYPKAYVNILMFLQHILLKKNFKGQKFSAKLTKFLKEFEKY